MGFEANDRRGSTPCCFHKVHVLVVVHSEQCALVASESNTIPHRVIYGAIVAGFPHQRVNCFNHCPTCETKVTNQNMFL